MKRRLLKKWLIVGRCLVSTKTSNVCEFAVTVWAISQAAANMKFEKTFGMNHAPALQVKDNFEVLSVKKLAYENHP